MSRSRRSRVESSRSGSSPDRKAVEFEFFFSSAASVSLQLS